MTIISILGLFVFLNWAKIRFELKEHSRLREELQKLESHREQQSKHICEDGVILENLRDKNEKLQEANSVLMETLNDSLVGIQMAKNCDDAWMEAVQMDLDEGLKKAKKIMEGGNDGRC